MVFKSRKKVNSSPVRGRSEHKAKRWRKKTSVWNITNLKWCNLH